MTECSDGDWVPNPFGSKTHVLVVSNQGSAAAAFSVATGMGTFSYQLDAGGAVTLRW